MEEFSQPVEAEGTQSGAAPQEAAASEAAAPEAEAAGQSASEADSTEAAAAEPARAEAAETAPLEAAASEAASAGAAAPEGEAAGPSAPEAAAPEPTAAEGAASETPLSVEELMQSQPAPETPAPAPQEDVQLMAVLEAVIYVAEEPLTVAQIAASLQQPEDRVRALLLQLTGEFETVGHGICIREIAGGFKMATKPEHHDAVRNFVKSLKPPLKLSLPALETLAVIAYKQPVTGPEIQEIRGVQGTGVLKTLLDRKLIAVAGRKNVVGKPMLYKTTKEFLIQFGLKDLSELPSLKEFEEIRRMALDNEAPAAEPPAAEAAAVPEPAAEPAPEAAAEPAAAAETETPPAASEEA
jgi:segregation and condensation protein B